MLLLLEVGNTNTGVGVHDGARLVASWRLTSRREQTSDEYGLFIHTLLRSRDIEPRRITAVAISNVVPPVQRTLEWMVEAYFGMAPFTVQPGVNVPLRSRSITRTRWAPTASATRSPPSPSTERPASWWTSARRRTSTA